MIWIAIVLLTIGISLLARAMEAFDDAFSSSDWLKFDEPESKKIDMDNSEYDWGHNIKNYMEE